VARFFTADTHFGHASIMKYDNRPVSTSEEMDELLINNWNAVVTKADIIYHCGDLCWRSPNFTKPIIQQLNGEIHLIIGNHDKLNQELIKMFASVAHLKRIKIDGQRIWLSHFPLKTWSGQNEGTWNLHGHSHGKLINSEMNAVDVGVINWDWSPVSFGVLQEYLND
jgi:calcineurin-like phosphoesterase family protein